LVCERGEIKNSQTAVPQANFNRVGRGIAENDRPGIVRAAVREGLRRPLHEFCGKLRFMRNDSKNSTHQTGVPGLRSHMNHSILSFEPHTYCPDPRFLHQNAEV
jgi:hypothetical protein